MASGVVAAAASRVRLRRARRAGARLHQGGDAGVLGVDADRQRVRLERARARCRAHCTACVGQPLPSTSTCSAVPRICRRSRRLRGEHGDVLVADRPGLGDRRADDFTPTAERRAEPHGVRRRHASVGEPQDTQRWFVIGRPADEPGQRRDVRRGVGRREHRRLVGAARPEVGGPWKKSTGSGSRPSPTCPGPGPARRRTTRSARPAGRRPSGSVITPAGVRDSWATKATPPTRASTASAVSPGPRRRRRRGAGRGGCHGAGQQLRRRGSGPGDELLTHRAARWSAGTSCRGRREPALDVAPGGRLGAVPSTSAISASERSSSTRSTTAARRGLAHARTTSRRASRSGSSRETRRQPGAGAGEGPRDRGLGDARRPRSGQGRSASSDGVRAAAHSSNPPAMGHHDAPGSTGWGACCRISTCASAPSRRARRAGPPDAASARRTPPGRAASASYAARAVGSGRISSSPRVDARPAPPPRCRRR